MDSLIAKLETEKEGSRELDAEIYEQVMQAAAWSVRAPMPTDLGRAPYYTTSLDAALTLVLEGWCLEISDDETEAGVLLHKGDPNESGFGGSVIGQDRIARAACIASLKARESEKADG